MTQKEYGGYIEIEHNNGKEYHSKAIALNSGRHCLEYLIRAKKIRKLYLPYFLCASIAKLCNKLQIGFAYYHTDINFRPVFTEKLSSGEWLYIVNYYGQLSENEIKQYKKDFINVIVDNAQSFFSHPVEGIDTLYTCRKFFGVTDGAYLYTDIVLDEPLEVDLSYKRVNFLLGRYEKTASEFYSEYSANNELFETESLKQMSKLTHNFLRGIDYAEVIKIRTKNFEYLHKKLCSINKLVLSVPRGAFMYPLYIENGAEIRKKLQQEKIYIPTLWPDVFDVCSDSELEYDMAKNILPLPIDQRYDLEDMENISQFLLY